MNINLFLSAQPIKNPPMTYLDFAKSGKVAEVKYHYVQMEYSQDRSLANIEAVHRLFLCRIPLPLLAKREYL